MLKEIKEDTDKCESIPCSWIGRLKIVKMSVLCKAIYRLNAIPNKYPKVFFFSEIENSSLKFIWNIKDLLIVKTILRKKNIGELTLPESKLVTELQ